MSSSSAFPPAPDQQEPDDDLDYLKFSSDSDIGLSPGEETDDASENESYQHHEYSQFTEIKEQMYQDKLNHLKKQLLQLSEGTHPDWIKRIKKLDQQLKERMIINTVVKELELEMAEQDFLNEKKNVVKEFEEKKVYLREQLLSELEEKQKMIELERTSMELTGDSLELKPVTTRKLRRRANDGLGNTLCGAGFKYGPGEKRRKQAPPTLKCLLEDKDIEDDLKIINKTLSLSAAASNSIKKELDQAGSGGSLRSASPNFARDARIEDGKLFYEKRWFRRGQTVWVEGKDGSYGATISAIGSEAIWVRRSEDNSKVSIYLSQLNKGKLGLKRRAQ